MGTSVPWEVRQGVMNSCRRMGEGFISGFELGLEGWVEFYCQSEKAGNTFQAQGSVGAKVKIFRYVVLHVWRWGEWLGQGDGRHHTRSSSTSCPFCLLLAHRILCGPTFYHCYAPSGSSRPLYWLYSAPSSFFKPSFTCPLLRGVPCPLLLT